MHGFSHAAIALTAQGLQGLQASATFAIQSATAFFAAHGLQGLQAARATLAPPTVAIDIVTASASGLKEDRLVFGFFRLDEVIVISKYLISMSKGGYRLGRTQAAQTRATLHKVIDTTC